MKSLPFTVLLALVCLAGSAGVVHANARLISVVAKDGGCVQGPNGGSVQFWEVEPGKTYELTIDDVEECGDEGTAATIWVRVNSSGVGNTDIQATWVEDEKYKFTFLIPADALCTMPLFYCTTPGQASTGERVLTADDDEDFHAHLRMASFNGCDNPVSLEGPGCRLTSTRSRTWAQVKQIYR